VTTVASLDGARYIWPGRLPGGWTRQGDTAVLRTVLAAPRCTDPDPALASTGLSQGGLLFGAGSAVALLLAGLALLLVRLRRSTMRD
jgi:hypothetical protein